MNSNTKYKITICLLLLVVGFMGVSAYNSRDSIDKDDNSFDPNVNQITEMSKEDRKAALDEMVAEGMISINYQPTAIFDDVTSESFKVSNIENNKYPIAFTISDQDGETVYESDLIDLGYELTSITLDKSYPKGNYDWRIVIGYAGEGNVSSSFPLKVTIN